MHQQQQNSAMEVNVTFYSEPKKNEAKSLEAGRPIYDDFILAKITYPGDRNRIHVVPAHEKTIFIKGNERLSYAEAYSEKFEAFMKNVSYVGEGTPLSEALFISAAQRKDLEYFNIFTVEGLAAIPDPKKLGMMGGKLKEQAKAYLENALNGAGVSSLAAENAALKAELEALRLNQYVNKKEERDKNLPDNANETNLQGDLGKWKAPYKIASLSDQDIKEEIKRLSGSRPVGNPSRGTLEAMLQDLLEQAE